MMFNRHVVYSVISSSVFSQIVTCNERLRGLIELGIWEIFKGFRSGGIWWVFKDFDVDFMGNLVQF